MQNLLFLFAFLMTICNFSQERDALVYFTDKQNVAASIANPETILSSKALERKALHGISIDERDVPVNENYKSIIASQSGIVVLAKSKWLNTVYVRGTVSAIENLQNIEFVQEIEFMDRNLNRSFPSPRLDDKFEVEVSNRIDYNYGYASNQIEMINVDVLHSQDLTGEGIPIAFMDNGYPNIMSNPAYVAMRNENRLLGYYDFVNRTETTQGSGNHGSATLSTAAAFLDGEFVGTAPKASYYLFITEDGSQESPVEEALWVEALERADSLGVFITNTSLGYISFDIPEYNYDFQYLDGFSTIGARGSNIAFEKGMLNVVSAGNEGNRSGFITSPADAPGSFTVGAVDMNGNYADFSSRGPNSSGRVKPDVMAQGAYAAIVNEYGEVTYSNGTSFSGPIIAGAIASLWQAAPQLKNEVIMQAIRESAHLYDQPTDEMGYGIPNFDDALNRIQQLNLEHTRKEKLFAIYPNPVKDNLNISFPGTIQKASLSIYNVLGKKIIETEINPDSNKINLSTLTSDVYLVSITAENKTSTFKIIKQK